MLRTWLSLALALLLVASGCATTRVLRAPVSDCSLDCHDPRASSGEQIMCLESCSGASFSERPCDPSERADTVCVAEDPEEEARKNDPNGIGELIGIVLGVAAGVALVVLAGTSR